MSIVLHHYPASLFSEKARLLLGYHQLSWLSVIISNVMPRPLLMPLSGGYRKTPILQIDANVYCDTKIIARALARESGDWRLFEQGFNAQRVADWADTTLFQVTVAMNFRPEAISAMMSQITAEDAAAFQADRAKLAEGGSIVRLAPVAAAAILQEALAELEEQLSGRAYLFGSQPTTADFSVYHCLWFLRNNPVNAPLLEGFGGTLAWLARMAGYGHGDVTEISAEEALELGRDATPVLPALDPTAAESECRAGEQVAVTPCDYGRIPVTGRLAAHTAHEIVLLRETAAAGQIMTHFPSAGFELVRADQGSPER